jgi:hypothetical protein
MPPTHVFVAMTRKEAGAAAGASSSRHGPTTSTLASLARAALNGPKNELLLAHLRGDEDFEEQLVEYHSRTKAKKPKRRRAIPVYNRPDYDWIGPC